MRNLFDHRAIARSFSRASKSYDAAAEIQRIARTELLERLNNFKLKPEKILDLGAGTGAASMALKRRYPNANVIALDFAPAMLVTSGQHLNWRARLLSGRFSPSFLRVAGTAHKLPLKESCVDLIFSNLMLQWCDNLDDVLIEIRRVLAPGGVFIFSTFGPSTLKELRIAFALVDTHPHVNTFVDMHDLGGALGRAGFQEPVLDIDRHLQKYPDVMTLLRELKAIGAGNAMQGRSRGLTGRVRFAQMQNEYTALSDSPLSIPVTWDIIYASSFSPQSPKFVAATGATEIKVPLNQIGWRR